MDDNQNNGGGGGTAGFVMLTFVVGAFALWTYFSK